jgi:hypothetical protein
MVARLAIVAAAVGGRLAIPYESIRFDGEQQRTGVFLHSTRNAEGVAQAHIQWLGLHTHTFDPPSFRRPLPH